MEGQLWRVTMEGDYGGQLWRGDYGRVTMEGDYGGVTMEGDYGGRLWRGNYGGRLWRATIEGQLWRGDYGGVTMEGRLWRATMEGWLWRGDYGGRLWRDDYGGRLWRATMKGLDYGGATMEEGNHLLFFGNFSAIVGHLGKVLRWALSLKIWDCYQLDLKSRDFELSDDVWPMIRFGKFLEFISWTNHFAVVLLHITSTKPGMWAALPVSHNHIQIVNWAYTIPICSANLTWIHQVSLWSL